MFHFWRFFKKSDKDDVVQLKVFRKRQEYTYFKWKNPKRRRISILLVSKIGSNILIFYESHSNDFSIQCHLSFIIKKYIYLMICIINALLCKILFIASD